MRLFEEGNASDDRSFLCLAFADIKDKEAAASTEAYTDYVAFATAYNAQANIIAQDIVTHKK